MYMVIDKSSERSFREVSQQYRLIGGYGFTCTEEEFIEWTKKAFQDYLGEIKDPTLQDMIDAANECGWTVFTLDLAGEDD